MKYQLFYNKNYYVYIKTFTLIHECGVYWYNGFVNGRYAEFIPRTVVRDSDCVLGAYV